MTSSGFSIETTLWAPSTMATAGEQPVVGPDEPAPCRLGGDRSPGGAHPGVDHGQSNSWGRYE